MKRILLGSVGVLALTIAAQPVLGADLPVKAPSAPIIWNWTGFYGGIHVGALAGDTSFSDPYGAAIFGDIVHTPGFLAGGQIGYNWQASGSPMVFGIEADASAITSDGTNTCFAVSSLFISSDCHVHPSATLTLTGRAGMALGPEGHTLVYAKGGLAVVHNNVDITGGGNAGGGSGGPFAAFFATTASYNRMGGTVGAGIEQALSPAWSFRLEYDYMRFGGQNVATPTTAITTPNAVAAVVAANTTNVTQDLHEVKVGVNYHFGANPSLGWAAPAPVGLPVKAPVYKAPAPTTWLAGWEFEAGSRFGWSTGKFAWTIQQPSPISRLTYDHMSGPVGELFQRVDSPWGIFAKGNIGIGTSGGKQNDEDWNGAGFGYSNTISELREGKFAYGTGDVGYDFLRGRGYKVDAFVGYTYFDQRTSTFGCTQIAAPLLPFTSCATTFPTSQLVGQQQSTWQGWRIGLGGETDLFDRWKLSAEVAYLPDVSMTGRDNHLLRSLTTYFDQQGTGRGVQLEAALDYFVTSHWSVGLAGRYMAMWTTDATDQIFTPNRDVNGAPTSVPIGRTVIPARFDTSRLSIMAQSTFKFDWSE